MTNQTAIKILSSHFNERFIMAQQDKAVAEAQLKADRYLAESQNMMADYNNSGDVVWYEVSERLLTMYYQWSNIRLDLENMDFETFSQWFNRQQIIKSQRGQ